MSVDDDTALSDAGIRLSPEQIQEITARASELGQAQSRLGRRVRSARREVQAMKESIEHLYGDLREMEVEIDATVSAGRKLKHPQDTSEDFDALELDRYGGIQQLSRSVVERVGELVEIHQRLQELTAESTSLLEKQVQAGRELRQAVDAVGGPFEEAAGGTEQALVVMVEDTVLAIPLDDVDAVIPINAESVAGAASAKPLMVVTHHGSDYQVSRVSVLLGIAKNGHEADESDAPHAVLVRTRERRLALRVTEVVGRQVIASKALGPPLSGVDWIRGVGIVDDGRVAIVPEFDALLLRANGPSETTPARDAHAPPTVMVVDDSLTVRRFAERLLVRQGMQVCTARDGVDAFEQLQESVPDLMLLDIEMPRMDGFELAAAIRDDPRLASLPIIMISSRVGEKHTKRAQALGVNAFIGKPYKEEDLLHQIGALLARS